MVTGWLLTVVVLVAGDRHHGNDHQHHRHHGNVHLLCHQHHHQRHHGNVINITTAATMVTFIVVVINISNTATMETSLNIIVINIVVVIMIMVVISSIGEMTKKAEKIREQHSLAVHLCMLSVKTKKALFHKKNDLFRFF